LLTDQDLQKVQEASRQISQPVTMLVYGVQADDPFEKNLMNIARQIAGVSSDLVRMEDRNEPVLPGKPSITLSSGDAANISYLAAPEGLELAPFLDAMTWLGKGEALPDSDTLRSLDGLTSPTEILVLIAAVCPHCPGVLRTIVSMAVGRPLLGVTVADALQFTDLAERYKVKSTPTVIINEGATLVGQVTEREILELVLSVGDARSLTEVLKSMIESGRAEDAASLMCSKRQPEALLPLYVAPEFTRRMGALMAMEEALENDPRCLDPILEKLTELLSHEEVGLRGDTAEILGKIGNSRAIPALQKAAEDPDPDVREAARDALELLR